ncbi:MAG: haloacid dehalogenase [Armatimonadetes bacterium]|nr:haloacid dehalogenase [Armatimonadota bacterium]
MDQHETHQGHGLIALDAIAAQLREALDRKNAAREAALRLCRETIRISSRAIRAVHRLEFEAARGLIDEARATVERAKEALDQHPDLFFAGYVHDSQKEYVEAEAVYAMVRNMPLPDPTVLGVEPAAYLNGLAEAGSECRRFVLDRLREGSTEGADAVMRAMDDIYYELVTFDYPDAITGGLRRTTDAFRAVLERTRGDLTLTVQNNALREALRQAAEAKGG